jgi:hypothetical protein
MQVVEVDHLDAEPCQAFLAGTLQPFGTAIQLALFAIGHATFRRQHEFVAAILERLADQALIVAKAIDRGGVEEGVAGVQRA